MKNFPQNLSDWDQYRGMVHWLSPVVLLKTAKKVVDSTLFGKYADRRLVHAALDSPIDAARLIEDVCGGEKGVCGDADRPEVWVDYVADLGDGFDSTYAIAYSIGQKNLPVGDHLLPRADCLIMGGDQVYPDATREEYKRRMLRPYRAAFPRTAKAGADHPPVYLIPGNHDWYDGLTLFLANFCNGRKTPVGSWIASQRRSYFAIHLAHNWWIWGFDSQLGEDIDKPQADYFAAVSQKMARGAKVVLCASVPTWLKADRAGDKKGQDEYYRALHYVASIVQNNCKDARIPLVISGDLHHYTRYTAKESGTNFITAGGGGAFLHPTHFLSPSIDIKWPGKRGDEQTLAIAEDEHHTKAYYPAQSASRRLALGNLNFIFRNPDFCIVLALLYAICSLLMLAWDGYGQAAGDPGLYSQFQSQLSTLFPTPVSVLCLLALWALFYMVADIKIARSRLLERTMETAQSSDFRAFWKIRLAKAIAFISQRKFWLATGHWLFHAILLILGTAWASALAATYSFGENTYFGLLLVGMLILGFVGGFFWGAYLLIASFCWGDESNAAFSAMRLDSYRHFIRLKISKDVLTIYPIGIDESPSRGDWVMNDRYDDVAPDQDTPAIVPKKELGQHLIEDPIVIDVSSITALR